MRFFVVAAFLALGACSQEPPQTAATSPAAGCQAVVSAPWQATPQVEMTVEASTMGPDCEHAVATIAVRDANGVAFTQAYVANQVMVLASARDAAAMQTALSEWIVSTNSTFVTSSGLPDWPQGATGPSNGEFPFYVAENYTRDAYLALRARDVPVYCFVQGMESVNCLSLEDGILTTIGVQSFPG